MITQLMHEAAHLATAHTCGTGVVNQAHLLSPLNQTIEMVSPDAVLMLVGGQAKAFSQMIGNKGIGHFVLGEDTFVHRKDDQSVEVERTSLEHTHDLQSRKRLALERNRHPVGHTLQQPEEGIQTHLDSVLTHHLLHAIDRSEVMKNELLLNLARQASLCRRLLFLQLFLCGQPLVQGL